MTDTAPSSSDHSETRGLPGWLAGLIILLVLAAAAWVVYAYMYGKLPSFFGASEGQLFGRNDPPEQRRLRDRQEEMQRRQQNRPEGFNQGGNFGGGNRNRGGNRGGRGGGDVRAGDYIVSIERGFISDEVNFNVRPVDAAAWQTADDRTYLLLARDSNNSASVKAIGLSEEQVAALRPLRGNYNNLRPEPPVQEAWRAVYKKYESAANDDAARKAAEVEFVELIKTTVPALAEPYKQGLKTRVEQIKKVVTPEQVEKFKGMGGGR